MAEMVSEQKGKATKIIPSILMCPIYDVEVAKFFPLVASLTLIKVTGVIVSML